MLACLVSSKLFEKDVNSIVSSHSFRVRGVASDIIPLLVVLEVEVIVLLLFLLVAFLNLNEAKTIAL